MRRVRTNTPLQALTLLNDPVFFEAARALARRLVVEGGPDPAGRVVLGFRLTTARRPTPVELEKARGFYQAQRAKFQHDEKVPAEAAPELAAWTMVSNVLLSLDETVTKE